RHEARRAAAADGLDHGGAAARARRLPEADGGERADRRPRAALSLAAGVRLGGDRRRYRARRDRSEVQPPLRPRRAELLREASAVDPDDADPGRYRWRTEDEQ